MQLKNQVVSLELAQKMKELGFKQESIFWWSRENLMHDFKLSSFARNIENPEEGFKLSAYTVSELGEMLKNIETKSSLEEIDFGGNKQHFWARETYDSHQGEFISRQNEADARAKMLIYLKENNLTH